MSQIKSVMYVLCCASYFVATFVDEPSAVDTQIRFYEGIDDNDGEYLWARNLEDAHLFDGEKEAILLAQELSKPSMAVSVLAVNYSEE